LGQYKNRQIINNKLLLIVLQWQIVQIVRPRLGDNGPPANVNGRPKIYTHNHYNIPTNHNVHINHIHITHENIKMLVLGTEAQPINKSIKITQHNMNTLCRYFRHMVERTFPVAV
jgi:hypothetical protein